MINILKEEARACLDRELIRRDRAEARTRFLLAVIAGIIGLGVFNANLLKFVIEKFSESLLAKALACCLGLIAICGIAAFILAFIVLHFYNSRSVPDAAEFARVPANFPNLNNEALQQSLLEMYAKLTAENSERNTKTEGYVIIISGLTMTIGILFVVFSILSIALKVQFS
jgi:hypothetical protein